MKDEQLKTLIKLKQLYLDEAIRYYKLSIVETHYNDSSTFRHKSSLCEIFYKQLDNVLSLKD